MALFHTRQNLPSNPQGGNGQVTNTLDILSGLNPLSRHYKVQTGFSAAQSNGLTEGKVWENYRLS